MDAVQWAQERAVLRLFAGLWATGFGSDEPIAAADAVDALGKLYRAVRADLNAVHGACSGSEGEALLLQVAMEELRLMGFGGRDDDEINGGDVIEHVNRLLEHPAVGPSWMGTTSAPYWSLEAELASCGYCLGSSLSSLDDEGDPIYAIGSGEPIEEPELLPADVLLLAEDLTRATLGAGPEHPRPRT